MGDPNVDWHAMCLDAEKRYVEIWRECNKLLVERELWRKSAKELARDLGDVGYAYSEYENQKSNQYAR